jgi:hypothetical protein
MLSTIPQVGSAGLGLVWGWLIGLRRYDSRSWRAVAAGAASSSLATLEVYWLCGLTEAGCYVITALVALILHLGLTSYAKQRFRSGY